MPKYFFKLNQTYLIFFVTLFVAFFDNLTFAKKVLEVYPFSVSNIFFLFSLFFSFLLFLNILLNLVSFKKTVKPILIIFLIFGALIGYFNDTHGTIVNDAMIFNIIKTDLNEMYDLVNLKSLLTMFFLGIVPSLLVFKTEIKESTFKKELVLKLKVIFSSLAIISLLLVSNGKSFASFFREHKPLRYYTNPTFMVYSTGKVISKLLSNKNVPFQTIADDAIIMHDENAPKITIFIVGETARADHFSLNGYRKNTNPLLKNEDVISFSKMYSCGTSTATSVPCMFSKDGRSNFSEIGARNSENVLDILNKTKKVKVLWRDNNSDSKGVAERSNYEDYKNPELNKVCNPECRDEGMLIGLDEVIKNNKGKDIFIVLHQMGSHGPAYYKRYPDQFEIFKPACKTNQIEECHVDEINNSYDNTILYTDYFLSKVIEFLKNYSLNYQTSMFYVSDHGESLGENGLYLHGYPYLLAPDEQIRPASIFWADGIIRKNINWDLLKMTKDIQNSHDFVFHSILGLLDVKTQIYQDDLNLFSAKANNKKLKMLSEKK